MLFRVLYYRDAFCGPTALQQPYVNDIVTAEYAYILGSIHSLVLCIHPGCSCQTQVFQQ